jgi:hypothetical protein
MTAASLPREATAVNRHTARTLSYHSGVQPGGGRVLGAAAAGTFLVVALSFAPLARLFRYATLGTAGRGGELLLLVPASLVSALLHEKVLRGWVYGAFGKRLPVGLSAPVVAFLGAILDAYLRLVLLPRPSAPAVLAAGHAWLVEAGLGLGLCLLALGTGSTVPGGLALGLVWIARFGLSVTFVGGVVPLMELVAAWAAPAAVAAVLARPLTPWREEVFG